ncbi:pentapeptide repeat-containing protein [Kovacikia minuta CCNUW1]|uniref:pentapeptide repeat-containing protein n=1 Tax=Kovacikia minuta TaxID=2931930 RepID=UPI001CCF5B30|nr:pentapeptide repeat-containing protein [Kovacikia minuta]UBF23887.1 pentapeptide repeat-containing protein [Kovacikia minuta CCNUW1]
MQSIYVCAATSLLIGLSSISQVSAIPEHVKRLKDRNECRGCNLRNENLSGFNLTNADLKEADLENADLKGANLQNANFKGAKGLTPEQVKVASNWKNALYDDGFRKRLGLPTGK